MDKTTASIEPNPNRKQPFVRPARKRCLPRYCFLVLIVDCAGSDAYPCQELSLEPLITRRDIALLSLLYKCIDTSMTSSVHLNLPHRTSRRLPNYFGLARVYGGIDAFNLSALPLAIRLWNDLPDNLVSKRDHAKFCDIKKIYICMLQNLIFRIFHFPHSVCL